MDPGLEFKVAMEEAERLRAALVYGDADQDHTIQRISKAISVQVCLNQVVLCRHEPYLHDCQPARLALCCSSRSHSSVRYAMRPAQPHLD